MQQQQHRPEYIEKAAQYLQQYEKEAIQDLALAYPNETRSLVVDIRDVERYDVDLADDILREPSRWIPQFEAAVQDVDHPVAVDLDNVNVRFLTPERNHVSAGKVARREGGEYVGVTGVLSQVTKQFERLEKAVYVCQRCGSETVVPQATAPKAEEKRQDPYQCESCERQGPFDIDPQASEYVDYRKLRIAQPPGEGAAGDQLVIDAYVKDDAVNVDNDVSPDAEPLSYRAGERVAVHGILERVPQSKDSLNFTYRLDGRAVTFNDSLSDTESVDLLDVRETAQRPESSDVFRASMSPGTYDTDNWSLVKKVSEAFLFGAPTINIDGEGKRGNIHFAIFGDPGLNKSQFMQSLRNLAPDSAYVSATGKQVSEVGFTAAAVKDDFGGETFTLKPGVLPRAGTHAFIDEIDKFDGDLTALNSALEFPQEITIEKAGIRAQLDTGSGVMVMGNPDGGRFDPDLDPWEQIRSVVDPSLLSRFDAVIPLRDVPDEDVDENIAWHIVEHHSEQARRAQGKLDIDDADLSRRDHSIGFLRAWIEEGRDIDPLLTDKARQTLVEFFASGRGDGEGRTPNYTFRKLDAGIRFAKAYARRDLSDEATDVHAQEAVDVLRPIIGLTHTDGEGLNPDVLNGNGWQSQHDRVNDIMSALRTADDPQSMSDIADTTGLPKRKVEHRIEKLKRKGEVVEPETGVYRAT